MNLLTQNLILSAFASSQRILTTKGDFLQTINVPQYLPVLAALETAINEHCDEAVTAYSETEYETVLNKMQWLKQIIKGTESQQPIPSTWGSKFDAKEPICQKKLASKYIEHVHASTNFEDIDAATTSGSYTLKLIALGEKKELIKAYIIQKLVKLFDQEFNQAEVMGVPLTTRTAHRVLEESWKSEFIVGKSLHTLYKPVLEEAMNIQRNKLAKDILEATFKDLPGIAFRPPIDLLYLKNATNHVATHSMFLIILQEFKKILKTADETTYDKAIGAAVTAVVTQVDISEAVLTERRSIIDSAWCRALLESMKTVHVKELKKAKNQLADSFALIHKDLIEAKVADTYYLRQVLIAAADSGSGKVVTTKFENRGHTLKFIKRRDDSIYNSYVDMKLANEKAANTHSADDLKKKLEEAFYKPSKWDTLPIGESSKWDNFRDFKFHTDENFHDKQISDYGNKRIINIPVEFNDSAFDAAEEVSTSASISTPKTSKTKAFGLFNKVMDNIRARTCINFFRVTKTQDLQKLKEKGKQYIQLTKASSTERGCDEIIGKKPGEIPTVQPFSEPCLKNNDSELPTGVAHYFMHHLGFDNEHQRQDAGTHVLPITSQDKLPMMNGRPGHNTTYSNTDNASVLTGEYDITSVMHWSQDWTVAQPNQPRPSHMRGGEKSLFSNIDIDKINNLYCKTEYREKRVCDELITNDGDVVNYEGKVADCLEKNNAKANIFFQPRKGAQNYTIEATVTYKTLNSTEVRRLAGSKVWSSDMEIADGHALFVNGVAAKCGKAKIYIESKEGNKFVCSDSQRLKTLKITSKCGRSMKLQYQVDGAYGQHSGKSMLEIGGVEYKKCDKFDHSLTAQNNASGSIFKLFTLVTIFII